MDRIMKNLEMAGAVDKTEAAVADDEEKDLMLMKRKDADEQDQPILGKGEDELVITVPSSQTNGTDSKSNSAEHQDENIITNGDCDTRGTNGTSTSAVGTGEDEEAVGENGVEAASETEENLRQNGDSISELLDSSQEAVENTISKKEGDEAQETEQMEVEEQEESETKDMSQDKTDDEFSNNSEVTRLEEKDAIIADSKGLGNKADTSESLKSQISLEPVEAADNADDDDNEEDDLDIEAGLDKLFSGLEQKMNKEEEEEEKVDDKEVSQNSEPITQEKSDNGGTEDLSSDKEERQKNGEKQKAFEDENEKIPEEDEEEDESMQTVDHDQALKDLEQIEKSTKRILDDDTEAGSRAEAGPASKKLRTEEEPVKAECAQQQRTKKIRKVLTKMKRSELEDLIERKMVEVLINKSEIGQLRQQCDSYQVLWCVNVTCCAKIHDLT